MASMRTIGRVAAACAAVWVAAAPAQTQVDLDREFEFASKLVESGFADYAERLVDEILRMNPDQKDRATVLQVEILSSRRKFDDAEKMLESIPANNPKAQAARLALANGLFRGREVERARAQYEAFFKGYKAVPTDPDLRRFYMDAAYRFGQMLERAGDLPAAAEAYENILKAKPESAVKRRISQDMSVLLVRAARAAKGEEQKKLLDRAWKLCEEIQWGDAGIDVAFCNSIVTMANIEVMRNRPEEAAKLIRQNLDLMRGVDDFLREENLPLSQSPMAYARHMLGDLYEKEAARKEAKSDAKMKLLVDAITQHVNVFARYPDSDWAAESGARTEALRDLVRNEFGRELKIDYGEHLQNAVAAQYRLVDDMFARKQYPETIRSALRILNAFPTASEMGPLFIPLLISLAETEPKDAPAFLLDATIDHIAEVRQADASSGLALLALGKHLFDKGSEAGCIRVYLAFADAFPKNERAPHVLYLAAGMMKKGGDTLGARETLERIVANYPKDQFFLRALSTLGWDRYEAKDYETSAAAFEKFVAESPAAHIRVLAQFTLADAYMRMEQFDKAARAYGQVAEWCGPKDNNPYARTGDEIKKAAELLETSRFFVGFALFKLPAEGDAKGRVRDAAIQTLDRFVQDNPKSDLAPKALNLIGAIHLDLGQSEPASTAFARLQKEYPESEDGRSALFSFIRAANEIGRMDLIEENLGKMLAGESEKGPLKAATPDQLVRIGEWLAAGESHAGAIKAFRRVLDTGTEDRAILERSLYGLGVSAYALKDRETTITTLEDMMLRYPRSGLFYEARTLLSRAYREAGQYREAVATLNEIFKVAEKAVDVNRASMDLARVQFEYSQLLSGTGKTQEAEDSLRQSIASFERVAMLGDPRNEEIRPMIEESLREAIKIYEMLGRSRQGDEACGRYLELFADRPEAAAIRKAQQAFRLKAAAEAPAPVPGT